MGDPARGVRRVAVAIDHNRARTAPSDRDTRIFQGRTRIITAMPSLSDENAHTTAIRVLVADDHFAVSTGLRLLLEGEPDLEMVGTAADGEEAVALVAKERPDVVVMDLSMPLLGGVQAARRMRLLAPESRVLILSGHVQRSVIRAAYEAGVSGYLSKDVPAGDLLDAIRRAHAGEDVFSAGAGGPLLLAGTPE